jgi:hypothetical protein
MAAVTGQSLLTGLYAGPRAERETAGWRTGPGPDLAGTGKPEMAIWRRARSDSEPGDEPAGGGPAPCADLGTARGSAGAHGARLDALRALSNSSSSS